jgi:hypothetical protein
LARQLVEQEFFLAGISAIGADVSAVPHALRFATPQECLVSMVDDSVYQVLFA